MAGTRHVFRAHFAQPAIPPLEALHLLANPLLAHLELARMRQSDPAKHLTDVRWVAQDGMCGTTSAS